MSLEERAARAAEEEKQKQAAWREADRRAKREDILPHAIDIVRSALGVATSPDDWRMSDDDSGKPSLTLSVDGVMVNVLRTYEEDVTKERWSETSGDSYGSSHFYRGWVWNPAKSSWQQLTLANFGEAQQAWKAAKQAEREKQSENSGWGPLRDMGRMLPAVLEEQDDAYIHRIWDNGDQLRMMTWALSFLVDDLRKLDIDPADYARHTIAYATKEETAEKGQA
jgi:hypothetical protein